VDPNDVSDPEESDQEGAEWQENDKGKSHSGSVDYGKGRHLGRSWKMILDAMMSSVMNASPFCSEVS